ncbi:MAG: dihydrofolate reductase [Clostridia bacterium]|nr:dihydrofolate reductase [Clostridia bacterium]
MLSIIVAKAKNNTIGKNNQIVWDLPEDKKRFKNLTDGHVIIMGRKTFESLGEVLPNRKHIVMTENHALSIADENVQIVHSMLELQQYIEDENENFVIGGAMIYNLLMPHVSKMYVTELDKDFEGNAIFPKINPEVWEEVSREEGPADGINNFKYYFVEYKRK